MTRKPVHNKINFYERWELGEFGNKLRTWNSLEDVLASGYTLPVGIRYKTNMSRVHSYQIPIEKLEDRVQELMREGADPRLMTFSETPPDDKLLIQGEVHQTPKGLTLLFSKRKFMSCRMGLATDGKEVSGIVAVEMLKHYLDPASYEDIRNLLDDFEGHVVEFSTFGVKVGSIPNRNTLIWEVRHY